MIRLPLPFPPSTNRIWRHVGTRVLLSAAGRQYRAEVGWVVAAARVQGFGRRTVKLSIDAYMPDKRRRDLDNLLKASMDALQAARVFEDDSQIVDLSIRNRGVDKESPRLDVTIEAA